MSIEIARLIVTHLIEKYDVKTANAIFVEGLACTFMELRPILQTAGSYLRCKAILNLIAVHDNVCKIRTCTAQAPLSREISFVFIAFVIVSIFTFGRKTKTKPKVQYFKQISKETPNQIM